MDYGCYWLLPLLVVSAVIGIIPATIAYKKGGSFFTWWLFGAAFFIVALPLAILMEPIETPSSDIRVCPYCAEKIKLEARVCKHCGRDLPAPYVVPPKYSLDWLPEADKQAIRQNSPSKNLTSAKHFIEQKSWHRAIASLQAVTMTADMDSKVYGEANMLLYKMLSGVQATDKPHE